MHPVVAKIPFEGGAWTLRSYGLSVALALLLGWALLVARGPNVRERARAFALALAAGLAAAWVTGHAAGQSLEGWAGIFVVTPLVLRWESRLALSRGRLALALGVGFALSGVGAWLEGARYGRVWEGPSWLARLGTYPRWPDELGPPALAAQLRAGQVPLDATETLATHPVALYAAAVALLAGVAGWLRPCAAWLALTLLALADAALCLLRADPGALPCGLMALASAVLFGWSGKGRARDEEHTAPVRAST